jgi:hypothetical protein
VELPSSGDFQGVGHGLYRLLAAVAFLAPSAELLAVETRSFKQFRTTPGDATAMRSCFNHDMEVAHLHSDLLWIISDN